MRPGSIQKRGGSARRILVGETTLHAGKEGGGALRRKGEYSPVSPRNRSLSHIEEVEKKRRYSWKIGKKESLQKGGIDGEVKSQIRPHAGRD